MASCKTTGRLSSYRSTMNRAKHRNQIFTGYQKEQSKLFEPERKGRSSPSPSLSSPRHGPALVKAEPEQNEHLVAQQASLYNHLWMKYDRAHPKGMALTRVERAVLPPNGDGDGSPVLSMFPSIGHTNPKCRWAKARRPGTSFRSSKQQYFRDAFVTY